MSESFEAEWNPPVPVCPNCQTAMEENTAVSTQTLRQFVCHCKGVVFYVNVHRGQKGKADN